MRTVTLASVLTIVFTTSLACAQTTDLDKVLAELKCQDFSKNADGYWTSGPKTKIGSMQLPNSTFGVGMIKFSGVDIAEVLDQKCEKSAQ